MEEYFPLLERLTSLLFYWAKIGVLLTFVVLIAVICLIFSSVWYAALYKYYYRLEDYGNEKIWMPCWRNLALTWRMIGRVWHGIEIIETAKIPWDELSGALFILYHGSMPLDFAYLMSEMILKRHRLPRILAHHFTIKSNPTAGLKALGLFPGPYEELVKVLQDGHLVFLAPGGALEAVLGDSNYKLIWNNRKGFARAAREAKVPIIPVFTQNSREAFGGIKMPLGISDYFYKKFGVPIGFLYGGLPVKMRIFLGDVIPYDEGCSTDELAVKVTTALQDLIKKHQRIPGSIIHALGERFS